MKSSHDGGDEDAQKKEWRDLVLSRFAVPPQGTAPNGVAFGSLVALSPTEALHFGGADEFRPFGGVNIFHTVSGWKALEEDSLLRPQPRYAHAAVLAGSRFFVFGGMRCVQEEVDAGDACFDPPLALPPDSSGKPRLWCHRGTPASDCFALDVNTGEWQQLDDLPAPRAFHTACLVGDRYAVLLGGCSDARLTQAEDSLWVFDTEDCRWLVCKQTGDVPGPRHGQQTCFSPNDHCVYLFGGEPSMPFGAPPPTAPSDDASNYDVDEDNEDEGSSNTHSVTDGAVYILDVAPLLQAGTAEQMHWQRSEIRGRSRAASRRHFAMQLTGNRLLCFGGLTSKATSDVYAFDLNSKRWLRPMQEGVINIAGHASCLMGNKMMLFGGCRAQAMDATLCEVLASVAGEAGAAVTGARLLRQVQFATLLKLRREMLKDACKGKLVILGDAAVGKSCLLERFAEDVYTDSHPSTVGFDFFSVSAMVRGKVVNLQLWDTAGQERFDGLTGNYYRNADGFVFVYDSTRRATFSHVERWISRVKEHHSFNENCLKLIIGNKQDLVHKVQVTHKEGMDLADSLGGIYLGTSARTGDGVDFAFLIAAAQLVQLRTKNPANKAVEFRLEAASEEAADPRTALASLGRLCGSC